MEHALKLDQFEVIFHIALIFNFAYSIENFGKHIKLFFSSPSYAFADFILINLYKVMQSSIDRDVSQLGSLSTNTEGTVKKFMRVIKKINDRKTRILKRVPSNDSTSNDENFGFNEKFEAAYLLAAFFSFCMLLLIGFENYLIGEKFFQALFYIDLILSIIFLLLFALSFFPKVGKIPHYSVLIIFITLLIVFKLLYNSADIHSHKVPNEICTISFSVLLVLVPLLMHFWRVIVDLANLTVISIFFSLGVIPIIWTHQIESRRISKAVKLLKKNGYNAQKDVTSSITPPLPPQPPA